MAMYAGSSGPAVRWTIAVFGFAVVFISRALPLISHPAKASFFARMMSAFEAAGKIHLPAFNGADFRA
jgi:hypothetical protein